MALAADDPRRRRLGYGLVAAGVLVIVVAVLYVLEAADGPGAAPTQFAQRRSYDQVKVEVHRVFPLAFLVALGGLGLALYGGRFLREGEER